MRGGVRADDELKLRDTLKRVEELEPKRIRLRSLVTLHLVVQRLHHVADGELVDVDDCFTQLRKWVVVRVPALATTARVPVPANRQHAVRADMPLRAVDVWRVNEDAGIE